MKRTSMSYHGHIKNGVVVLDEPTDLEDGTQVVVEVAAKSSIATAPLDVRIERYRSLIGALDTMPQDWAESHDAYLRDQQDA